MQKITITRLVVSLACLLTAGAASAQDAIVTTTAPIFVLPDSNRAPLRTAAVNTRLQVLEEKPEGWVRVEFQDPQFGKRVGFIEARYVKILRPELEPMDLSVGREPARAPDAPKIAHPSTPPAAQPLSPRRPFARGWIDVNLGFAVPAESRYGTIFVGELFRETATLTADYHSPLGAEFDFGGGVMLTPAFGIGVSFAGTAHQDTAELGIRIPHPTFFDAHATDTETTDDKLVRSEGSVNIQAMFVSRVSDRITARVFAGPSYFRMRQDAVSNILFDQDFLIFSPVHSVDITTYRTATIEFEDGGGWGFHVGGDVNIFFTRVVGLGWFAKYSRGTVEVFEPLSEVDGEFKTGGFQTGGGLRLRF
jgi:hypothetical protein